MKRARGFTLIEVLAVLFLTALVLGVALDFFVDLSNESAHATESTRELRRATTLVDRIAMDLERTLLVKKPKETDPLAHPWVFLAEPNISEDGSDRILFMERAEPPRGDETLASDLAMVAYTLEPHADGTTGYALHRWTSPQLPDRLVREFPRADDPDSLVLADGISYFALRFYGEAGEWLERWDSSQLVESSELPLAVEIRVALVPTTPADLLVAAEPTIYSRVVLLPMRPLDMEALKDPTKAAGGEEGEEDDGLTVADCVDFTLIGSDPSTAGSVDVPPVNPGDMQALVDLVNNAPNLPWAPYKPMFGNHPSVRPNCR
jgi:prepilin-type N-terminal cleavage/methylation domain-containing protein